MWPALVVFYHRVRRRRRRISHRRQL